MADKNSIPDPAGVSAFFFGGSLPAVRIAAPAEDAGLRALARLIAPRSPAPAAAANIDVGSAGRSVPEAKPLDPAEMARVIAGLERKNDAMREELAATRERVRCLSDAVAAQAGLAASLEKLVANLERQKELLSGRAEAEPGRGAALGAPDWTAPATLLPRGMR
jgi:hypothetical protein